MIEIDGSHGEGGGQIIRTALAFSMLTQKPFHAKDIRKGRTEPGLKSQHLACIKALQKLSQCRATGAELGSMELTFSPAPIEPKNISINIGTAGSVTLLLQAILLPCLFAEKPITLHIIGGTDTKWATPVDHFRHVLLPQLQRFAAIHFRLIKRGYFPRGGGEIELSITPKDSIGNNENSSTSFIENLRKNIEPFSLEEQGKIISIHGVSHASKDLEKAQVCERQASCARTLLGTFDCPIKIERKYQDALSTGTGIILWASFDSGALVGADVLGERSLSSEQIGQAAAKQLREEIEAGACVDSHAADQLIPFLGLCGGTIKTSKITPHTLSNIFAVEQFLGSRFSIGKGKNSISSSRKIQQKGL